MYKLCIISKLISNLNFVKERCQRKVKFLYFNILLDSYLRCYTPILQTWHAFLFWPCYVSYVLLFQNDDYKSIDIQLSSLMSFNHI